MNQQTPGPFVAPSNSFWARLCDTPVTDILHGNVTGRMNPRRLIAQAQLPDEVCNAIWAAIQISRLHRSNRVRLTSELVDFAEGTLGAGTSSDQIVTQIAECAEILTLIGWSVPIGRLDTVSTERKLPAEARELLRRIIVRLHGRRTQRGEAAFTVYSRMITDLGAGNSLESLTERFADANIVASFLSRPERRQALFNSDLPRSLVQFVHRVVKRTRLWACEKDDVARELCSHFADGLATGRSAEELIDNFGSPEMAARLIRRAKKRNRPLAWHAARRSLQVTVLAFAAVLVLWGLLAARFYSAHPTISRDFIAEDDERTRAISPDDRAWPLYREGLLKLDKSEAALGPGHKTVRAFLDALEKGPQHPDWPRVVQYLDKYSESLSLFVEGGKKRDFGYIYRDPDNDVWLAKVSGRTWSTFYPPGQPALTRVRFHVQDLQFVELLLSAGASQAIVQGNSAQVVDYWNAELGLANQIWHAEQSAVTDMSACAFLRRTCNQFREVLADQPQLLNDDQLIQLAHRLANVLDGSPEIRLEELRMFAEDYLQLAYTDDGRQNGRFTPTGIEELLRFAEPKARIREEIIGWEGSMEYLETCGPLIAALVADRLEMRAKLLELGDKFVEEHTCPMWKRNDYPLRTEMQILIETPHLRRKYFPAVVLFYIGSDSNSIIRLLRERTTAARDAALVAIALELHHRRTKQWPATLEELVPQLLPTVPVDPFDGKPLRYRIVDGKPVVYSVGANRVDDGSALPTDGKPGWMTTNGDWRLFPPVPEEEP